MPPSQSLIQVQTLASAGRIAEAADALVAAAECNEGDALFELALWRISGQIVRRDTAAARTLMGRAADAGHLEAALYFAHFLANGTGGEPDWQRARQLLEGLRGQHPRADEQLDLLCGMSIGDDGEPAADAELETLSEQPLVRRFPDFLSADECAYLMRRAAPRLTPSVVIDRATGRSHPHPVRRSDGTFFGVTEEDLVVNAINRRIAAATGTKPVQAEPLQIIHYSKGGEFRPHVDTGAPGGNQRIVTAIVYLTDDYEGGETRFMKTGLSFRGRIGELLTWRNVTAAGQPDPQTEHAGMPVTAGTKQIASRWIWAKPPVFPPPTPAVPNL